MNVASRIFPLLVFLSFAQAQSTQSWRGKTSEDRALVISVVGGSVDSVSLSVGVSCLQAVDEGTKVFSGSPGAISGKAVRFSGQATTACGAMQVRLEGTIDGARASGSLTIIPPKLAENSEKKRVAWTAEREAPSR
jgi:hypothetical protein